MRYRRLGKTGYKVSAVGIGTWAMGGDWGQVDDDESLRALHAAVDAGVTFFDTADVYGDGRSERLLAKLRSERDEELVIATKIGRRVAQEPGAYNARNIRSWLERCRDNLQTQRLDLVQLHCPPTDVYYMPEVFDVLEEERLSGIIAAYGASVERVEEGLKAIEFPNLATIQIIFNAFRQRPAERLLDAAVERDVGVIARVPLASGLLTGKFSEDAEFAEDDHRNFNREGGAFDRGETFAGVDLATGVQAATQMRDHVPEGATLAQFALQWILTHRGVSTVIPGAKNPDQVHENAGAADLSPLDDEALEAVRWLYEERIAPQVHARW